MIWPISIDGGVEMYLLSNKWKVGFEGQGQSKLVLKVTRGEVNYQLKLLA